MCAGRRQGWGSERGSSDAPATLPPPPPRRRGALSLLPQGGSSGSHEELGNHPIAGPLCPNLVEIGGVQRASWHTAFS